MADRLERIEEKIDSMAELLTRTEAILSGHIKQTNGATIHHYPPCAALNEHKQGHTRYLPYIMMVFSGMLGVGSLIVAIYSVAAR